MLGLRTNVRIPPFHRYQDRILIPLSTGNLFQHVPADLLLIEGIKRFTFCFPCFSSPRTPQSHKLDLLCLVFLLFQQLSARSVLPSSFSNLPTFLQNPLSFPFESTPPLNTLEFSLHCLPTFPFFPKLNQIIFPFFLFLVRFCS